ncbi:MAG: CoA ester lyase [Verrucomicrobiaceae bacterium]|nr:CoA ester lyase [Verrucomicrobiaceae bacterium]
MQLRPRRSVLYMPGNNQRALEKAKTLAADALIFDLEDAVAPDQKIAARAVLIEAVKNNDYGRREIAIRINALATTWGADDIKAVASTSVHAVCVPKIESAEQVRAIALALEHNGAPPSMAIWAMIETPLGVLNAREIVAAHPRLNVLIMGTSDLSKDLRVPHTPDRLGFITSLGLCVLAARAYGLDILDGVDLDLSGSEAFRAICAQGRTLGFDGKTLIHPNQIAGANDIFGPSAAVIEHAQRVLEVWWAAEKSGAGVAVLDGKLVENLHAAEAERVLAIAAAIAAVAP